MSHLQALARRRTVLLAVLICAVTATLFLVPSPPAEAYICGGQPNEIFTITYYSDASHTQSVGMCVQFCDAPDRCTGQITNYYHLLHRGCC
jgi:hypothetical protein